MATSGSDPEARADAVSPEERPDGLIPDEMRTG